MISRAFLVLLISASLTHAAALDPGPAVTTPRPAWGRPSTAALEKRASITTELSTCGYLNGDPNKPRTANLGFDCRVDTIHGLWGFCPTTVISATDCGLAAACQDSAGCSNICRYTNDPTLTTFTWYALPSFLPHRAYSGTSVHNLQFSNSIASNAAFCSTALLTFGVDQTYAYIGCGAGPSVDHLLVSPTANPSSKTSATTTPSSSAPSSSSSSLYSTSRSSVDPVSSSGATISTQPNNSLNNTGAVIGGVIGGLALVCVSGIAVVYLLRRRWMGKPAFRSPSKTAPAPETSFAEYNMEQESPGPAEVPLHESYVLPVELPGSGYR